MKNLTLASTLALSLTGCPKTQYVPQVEIQEEVLSESEKIQNDIERLAVVREEMAGYAVPLPDLLKSEYDGCLQALDCGLNFYISLSTDLKVLDDDKVASYCEGKNPDAIFATQSSTQPFYILCTESDRVNFSFRMDEEVSLVGRLSEAGLIREE